MDQFLCQQPGYLFDGRRDAVAIDPDNGIILTNHLRCAAFELPIDEAIGFGQAQGLDQALDFLEKDMQVLIKREGRYYYADLTYPAEGVSLNAADMDNVTIQDVESRTILAEIDRPSAITEVYQGAIYGHQGDTWIVERFDYQDRRAFVRKIDADYYTEADSETDVKVLRIGETTEHAGYVAHRGEVHVSTLSKAFKKIKFYTRENVGIGEIHLPPEEFETEACALVLRPELVARLGFLRGGEAACLQGIGELLQGLVPLFLRVDPGDVRVLSEVQHPHFQAPTLILYDRVPGGVGLSERVFRTHRDLLRAAVGVARRCPCTTGCPACVGPHPSLGARSKQVAIAILDGLLGDAPRARDAERAGGSEDAAAFGAEA